MPELFLFEEQISSLAQKCLSSTTTLCLLAPGSSSHPLESSVARVNVKVKKMNEVRAIGTFGRIPQVLNCSAPWNQPSFVYLLLLLREGSSSWKFQGGPEQSWTDFSGWQTHRVCWWRRPQVWQWCVISWTSCFFGHYVALVCWSCDLNLQGSSLDDRLWASPWQLAVLVYP